MKTGSILPIFHVAYTVAFLKKAIIIGLEVKTMNKLNEKIGYRIRNMREDRKYSREEISILTGISEKFLYSVEEKQSDMRISNLFKICNVINISPGYIISGAYDETEQFSFLFNRLASSQKTQALEILNILYEP